MELQERTTASIVIFDTSGSMMHAFPGASSRLDFARRVLDTELPVLVDRRAAFGLKQFDGAGGIETVLPLKIHSQASLQTAFNRLRTIPKGGSPLAKAMIEATHELMEGPVHGRAIVALSDGEAAGRQPAEMADAFARMRSFDDHWGSRIRPFFIGVGELSTDEFARFNLESGRLGGGLFPLDLAGDPSAALDQASRAFEYASNQSEDRQHQWVLSLNQQLNAQALALRLMLDQQRAKRKSEDEAVTRNMLSLRIEQTEARNEYVAAVSNLKEEIGSLAQFLKETSRRGDEQDALLKELKGDFLALQQQLSTHRPFSTAFEWSVVAGLAAVLAVSVVTAIGLQGADKRIVDQFNIQIEEVASTVDRLWDIWGQ